MAVAQAHYGSDNFNGSSYAFTGDAYDARDIASKYLRGNGSNGRADRILLFDPNTLAGWDGSTATQHAIIIKGYDNGVYTYFDLQSGVSGSISVYDLNNGSVKGHIIEM